MLRRTVLNLRLKDFRNKGLFEPIQSLCRKTKHEPEPNATRTHSKANPEGKLGLFVVNFKRNCMKWRKLIAE